MPIRNTYDMYGSVAKFFHWFIAIFVVLMLCVGVSFGYLPKGDFRNFLVNVHKSLGVTILCFMVLRLLWRLTNKTPTMPFNMPRWQILFAKYTHILLYVLVMLMPLTGIIMSTASGHPVVFWWLWTIHLSWIPHDKNLGNFMFDLHGYIAWALSLLIGIHSLAALHHFINQDTIFKRMWPSSKQQKSLFH